MRKSQRIKELEAENERLKQVVERQTKAIRTLNMKNEYWLGEIRCMQGEIDGLKEEIENKDTVAMVESFWESISSTAEGLSTRAVTHGISESNLNSVWDYHLSIYPKFGFVPIFKGVKNKKGSEVKYNEETYVLQKKLHWVKK